MKFLIKIVAGISSSIVVTVMLFYFKNNITHVINGLLVGSGIAFWVSLIVDHTYPSDEVRQIKKEMARLRKIYDRKI